MKNILWIIPIILITVALMGCPGNKGSLPGEVNFDNDASYAIGLNIGASLREGMTADQVYPNIDQFLKGMRDGIEGRQARFDLEEARIKIDEAFNALQEKMKADAIKKETEYLAQNARKSGVTVTPSGLQYEIVEESEGQKPVLTDTVLVNYHATFIDGNVFDSSFDRGEPTTLSLNQVIEGWQEGLQLMSVGSKFIFTIPSALGYGEEGQRNPWSGEYIIPQFATLIFDVELLEINPNTGE